MTDAGAFLAGHPDTKSRLERVAALVDGFETPFGLELLATVHWLAAHESIAGADELTRATYAWNERKKQFTDRQIRLAIDRLQRTQWIVESGYGRSVNMSGPDQPPAREQRTPGRPRRSRDELSKGRANQATNSSCRNVRRTAGLRVAT
jgi:hypothetical protein